jgi:RNA polymerase sigma-70 factor (ECF subfamily)
MTEIDFDDFYHAHFRVLTVQLCAYTGELAQAQDLAQEAFCRAYARWSKVVQYDDPVAWVRRVAWNLAASRWRRLRTARAYLRRQREEHVAGPSPDRVVLTAALAKLPENQRRAVVMHHLADMTVAEIARQEGVAEGTVKSWLHRGRTTLATLLKERDDQPEESRD